MPKKTTPSQVIGVAGEDTVKLIAAARALTLKMISIEQDPDIVSVFSIARAHGYKVTSPLWHPELKAIIPLFEADEAKQKQEKVVEFPAAQQQAQDQSPDLA